MSKATASSTSKRHRAAILCGSAIGLLATIIALLAFGHLSLIIDTAGDHLRDFSTSRANGFPLRGRILACDGTPLAYSTRAGGIIDRRVYPLGRAASSVVGFCAGGTPAYRPVYGRNGFENVYDRELAAGRDVSTSIDPLRQQALHAQLTDLRRETESELAWGVEMSISNEAVLAVASLPDYDPIDLNDVSESSICNWAIVMGFNPGNILRPLLWPEGELGEAKLKARLKALGLGDPVGGFFDEAICETDFEKPWSPWCCTNTANGALISVTSLQLARAFCRLAREGNSVWAVYGSRRLMRVKSDDHLNNSNYLQTIVLTESDKVCVYTLKAPQKQSLSSALNLTGEKIPFGKETASTLMAADEYP